MEHVTRLNPEPPEQDLPPFQDSAKCEAAPASVVDAGPVDSRQAPLRGRPRKTTEPRTVATAINPALVLQMADALAAPALRKELDTAKKPTALAIVSQLRPILEALRAGTAPVCNGRPMSWRQIADRLASTTGLSKDSFRKAWGNETAERLRPPPRTKRSAPNRVKKPNITARNFPEAPVATPSSVRWSLADFGPLFDD